MITYVTYALSKMIFCTEVGETLLQYRFSRQGVLFYIEEHISRSPGTKIMCSIMSVKSTYGIQNIMCAAYNLESI